MAEIFGTDIFEAGKDKIKGLLDDLITDTAGNDPKILSAYDYPNIVNPTLNAVSVHIFSAEPLDQNTNSQSSAGTSLYYDMMFAIRVHIAHGNGAYDSDKVARLLNSVNNKMMKNIDMGDGFRIQYTTDLKFNELFEESDTKGGELLCQVRKYVTHERE